MKAMFGNCLARHGMVMTSHLWGYTSCRWNGGLPGHSSPYGVEEIVCTSSGSTHGTAGRSIQTRRQKLHVPLSSAPPTPATGRRMPSRTMAVTATSAAPVAGAPALIAAAAVLLSSGLSCHAYERGTDTHRARRATIGTLAMASSDRKGRILYECVSGRADTARNCLTRRGVVNR